MDISKRKNHKNEGFTIMELIVVVTGLAILSSLSIPNIIGRVKLNRIEQAKALMNSYALDCLAQYRSTTLSTRDFLDEARPEELDNKRLNTLQYQIDGEGKCENVAIKPLNDNEKDLFAFEFRMQKDAKEIMRIRKTGTPSYNDKYLDACKNWAGGDCTESEGQKARWAEEAALAEAKEECDLEYSAWLNAKNSGGFTAWDKSKQSCTREVFAFEGRPVNSLEAVDLALKEKYGRACADWRESKKNSKSTSPNGNPETKNPECGGVSYWFHSGEMFTNQAAWNAHDNLIKEQTCISNKANAITNGTQGEFTYTPTDGPPPCGDVVWLCDGKTYSSLDSYKATSCGSTEQGGGDGIKPHCVNFVPHPFCPKRDPIGPLCVCE